MVIFSIVIGNMKLKKSQLNGSSVNYTIFEPVARKTTWFFWLPTCNCYKFYLSSFAAYWSLKNLPIWFISHLVQYVHFESFPIWFIENILGHNLKTRFFKNHDSPKELLTTFSRRNYDKVYFESKWVCFTYPLNLQFGLIFSITLCSTSTILPIFTLESTFREFSSTEIQ